ncbi:MAG: hypothetical protein ACK521_09675 [bacterium]|jgi:hypothetical protein
MINRQIGQQILPESPNKSSAGATKMKDQKEPNKTADMGASKMAPVAPKEVEQNPFKKLIDISDLMDFEANPVECEKECQNILLRHNSELKNWY